MTPKKHKAANAAAPTNHSHPPAFTSLTSTTPSEISSVLEPYRGELLLHCYRLLGSLHDAEDLVQETMLRAWQHFDTFKGNSSQRTWLYTIATNACLNALKKRPPRTLSEFASPASDARSPLPSALPETHWLEPMPNSWLTEATDNPEARYTRRESISLAFLTVLQVLPPRQRAILLLSDVLDWHASEIALLLEISVSAVNSALHRARVTLAQRYHPQAHKRAAASPTDAATSMLLERYVRAWETDDVAGLVALLKEDATLSMPPVPCWYRGRESVCAVLNAYPFSTRSRHWRLYPTAANAQPAIVYYRFDQASESYEARGIQVLTLDASTPASPIFGIILFHSPSLVTTFGFPLYLPGNTRSA